MFDKLKSAEGKKNGSEKNITTQVNHAIICPIKKGYLMAQSLMTSGQNNPLKERNFSFCMTSIQEASSYIDKAREFVDGLELQLITYTEEDMEVTLDICKYARDKGIDIWLCPRPYKYNHNLPPVPKRFAAFTMRPEGYIIPAFYANYSYHYIPDPLNPNASNFMVEAGYESFWKRFIGIVNGYMWPESQLDVQGTNLMGVLADLGHRGTTRYATEYWRLPVYSDTCLEMWLEYCYKNSVFFENQLVRQFPVDKPEMVKNGGGKTVFIPGYVTLDDEMWTKVPVRDLPRFQGVWKHWYRFLSFNYCQNYLIQLSRHWHRIYGSNRSDWMGVLYFGSSQRMLSYGDFADQNGMIPKFSVCAGDYYGLDVKLLASSQEINYIIHESPAENSSYIIEQFNYLVPECKRGLMLHADQISSLDEEMEEIRWSIINSYQPRMLALFPLWNLLQEKVIWKPGPININPAVESDYRNSKAFALFIKYLEQYRHS